MAEAGLLRSVRLDESDERLFPRAARGGEWVVPGGFAFTFTQRDPETLVGAERQAFQRGFLGLESFGWSSLAVVSSVTEAQRRQLTERLAHLFVDRYGAPDLEAALAQAREEIAFAQSLCEHPSGTVLSLQRGLEGDGVVESFRVHKAQADWQGGQVFRAVPGDVVAGPCGEGRLD